MAEQSSFCKKLVTNSLTFPNNLTVKIHFYVGTLYLFFLKKDQFLVYIVTNNVIPDQSNAKKVSEQNFCRIVKKTAFILSV
ncbi:hypothetical protein COB21_04380 [Candidatus Aerophobetes bacterium]|uniref:Uncharacterized protein n=1 Tax=Aerophobetes bacterium TaxID=2030807 RepID=A0A2A4X1J7_UNCAE|nr:MAG: hypothetical protein COB21_04380 [Candidatus Aerophobetes bacterium]